MECDYTHLNHNSLVSQKKSGHQMRDYKGVYYNNSWYKHLILGWDCCDTHYRLLIEGPF
jgi:hypothetical protein